MTEQKRRTSDYPSQEIDRLILQEDDPKQRAFLIVLNSINNSLIANTDTIREVSDKLEKHLEQFEQHTTKDSELINKGRGMWKVAAWVIGVAQVAGLYIWQGARQDLAQINASLQSEQIEIAQIKTRVTSVEKSLEARK